ncbi:TPA: lipase family alpha/beta hydrolase [Providencia alcalifaciens]
MTDKSDKSAITSECQHISYYLPQWDKNGKCRWVDIQLQHKSLNAEAKCIVPPTKAIPVIFIPGIMGTNLKNKKGKSIWRADRVKGADTLPLAWKNGNERRELLNVKNTKVDSDGKIKTSSFTVYSDDGNLFPSREKRHWGEALYLSYGEFLDVFQTALVDDWQRDIKRMTNPELAKQIDKTMNINGVLSKLQALNKKNDGRYETDFTEQELSHFKHFLFPVHVFGYNWLVDNAISAAQLVDYIDNVIRTYKHEHGHGLAVEKVIIVTHSMGGLIARYASQVLGAKEKILGIVHGVIPDIGSPAAYRRMKTGAGKEGLPGLVLGKNAEKLMSVLAFAPAPLQLLPSPKYPTNWLKFESGESYPKVDPFEEIYLRNDVWWRLYEPDILDKDQVSIQKNEKSYATLMRDSVKTFINKIEQGQYHPNTYVFYGQKIESDNHLSWNPVKYKRELELSEDVLRRLPAVKNVRFEKQSDGKTYMIPTGDVPHYYYKVDDDHVYELVSSSGKGDGTVPVESLNEIKKHPLLKGWLVTNVSHQDAYEVSGLDPEKYSEAIKFTLQSIIKMVQEVDIRAAD